MTIKETLEKTTILFDDIDKYKPKMCVVKNKEENGLYHLKESRELEIQEIYRILYGLAKYISEKEPTDISRGFTFFISNKKRKEILKFEFIRNED